MSWIRDHFYNLVYPAFLAAEKKSTEIGPPVHVPISKHAPERLPTELKKLWSLCREHGVEWAYDVRAINTHGGTSKYRETARIHHNMLLRLLEASVTVMRREGCTRVFLPGRDIYMLAPMCARRGIPYLFVPELSRPVSEKPSIRAFLERLGVDGRELIIDTGYVGSIPRNLSRHFGVEFKFRLMSQTDQTERGRSKFERRPNQVFPNRNASRNEALETEYLAKYWKSGTHDAEGNIVQYFADKRNIQRAAVLTSMLFRGIPFWRVSAKPKPKHIGTEYAYNNQTAMMNFAPNQIATFTTGAGGTATNTTATIVNYGAGMIFAQPMIPSQMTAIAALNAVPTATHTQLLAGLPAPPAIPALPPAPPPV